MTDATDSPQHPPEPAQDTPPPVALDPADMTQTQLLRLGEAILTNVRAQHPRGSYERAAYEASLGLLGTFPQQPWWKRVLSRRRQRRAEKCMARLRSR